MTGTKQQEPNIIEVKYNLELDNEQEKNHYEALFTQDAKIE